MFLDNFNKVKDFMLPSLKNAIGSILGVDRYKTTCEGHFKLECLDKDDNVIDAFEDHNMIVTSARRSMAEIFFKSDCKYAHKLVLGTQGCKDYSKFKAKDETDGVVKERECIFSETSGVTYAIGTLVESVLKGDVFAVDNGISVKYYRAPEDFTSIALTQEELAKWVEVEVPYTYTMTFQLTGENCGLYDNLCTSGHGDIVKAELKDTSVVFTFYVDMDNGNDQYVDDKEMYDVPTTMFNEAGLYVNDRLFAMRTFPSKIKDESVKLRVIWTITF